MGKGRDTFIKKAMKWLLVKIPLGFVIITVLWVVALKWVPVFYTPLMASRSIQYRNDKNFHTHKTWVSYDKISPELAKAVITSEDNLFETHKGFDWKQIDNAVKEHDKKGRWVRGASTISQQTAKNVFLPPSRSFVRKGFEAYFTVLIEAIWGKKRIMEVYLNVAEMGKGIYGAEAAAKYIFGKKASALTKNESCLIAACLPNPLKRNAGKPSDYVRKRANMIVRMESNLSFPEWIAHKQ